METDFLVGMIWFEKRVGSLGGKDVPSGGERMWRRPSFD